MDLTQTSKAGSERYELALEAAGVGIWDNDLLTGAVSLGGAAYALYGLPRDKTLSLAELLDCLHPSDRARTEQLIARCLDATERCPYDNEYRIVTPGTETVLRWLRAKGRVQFTEEGIPYRFTGTVHDITADVRTRETQQKLLALVDNSIELMSVLENDQTNSYINKAGMDMLGFDNMEEVRATPITELHAPEDFAFVQANVLPGVLNEGRWSGVMNVRHRKTGEIFPVYNNTVRIHDPLTGEPLAVGAVMRDLRAEVAAKKALEESERNFRNLVIQAPVGICILRGEQLVFELANDSYLQLVRRSREELIGRPLAECLPEVREPGFDKILRDVLSTGKGFYGREVEVVQAHEGEQRRLYVDFSYELLEEAGRCPDRIVAVVIDVTDKVLARQRLQEAEEVLQQRVAERTVELERKNRELEEFTYVTSHDLQEPIRKVRLFLGRIGEEEGPKFSDRSHVYFQKVMDAAARMSYSLRELLQFASLSREEQFEEVDLNEIMDRVESDLELLIAQKGASVVRGPLPRIQGIGYQLHRLFYNLVNNALKFSRDSVPPLIRITSSRTDEQVVIEVSDNGIGFDSEHAEKIFTLFQRLHSRQEYEGNGIGLALCRKVVMNHSGEIRATGKPGEGSSFEVRLPVTP